MAEAVVAFFLEKLSTLLIEEANLLLGVDEEVRLLQNELDWMRLFIKNADVKRKADPEMKLMVRQIRDITFQAEDVIDEFILKIHQQRQTLIGRFFGCSFKSCIGCACQLLLLHGLGNQIKAINTRSKEIVANKSKYEFIQADESSNNEVFKRAHPIAEESNVVGIEDSTKQVKSLLMGRGGGGDDRRRRIVVSIVGMGGLGKTTLAKKLYNNNDVKKHFDCFAWISVSQEHRLKDLLISIIKCVKKSSSSTTTAHHHMEEDDLKKELREYLQGKRYLIVLDDIWDTEAWDGLNFAFPNEMNGSRVLLTTRNKHVALYADPSSPNSIHVLRFLNEMESWELFLKKIFPLMGGGGGEGSSSNDQENYSRCPLELVDLGKEMVGKCAGLPLAILVLGGLLSMKDRTRIIWSKVNASVNWQLISQGSIFEILALSYYDLPYYLKPCFMYMGLFPEDHEISASKLFQYWIAEGFVQKRGEETMEDVAEDYMEELIHRSMIQVGRWRYDGRVKTCRVHDLLHDLAIVESKEDQFFQIYGRIEFGEFSSNSNININVRRLTVHGGRDVEYGLINKEQQYFSQRHVRSLMFFGVYCDKQFWRSTCGVFKLLKVLELELCNSYTYTHYSLPQAIGELRHLKYLGLSNRNGSLILPNSIIKLVNLQTLKIKPGTVYSMPSQISSLHQLRHLYVDSIKPRSSWSRFDKCRRRRILSSRSTTSHDLEIGNLTNLQTLNIWSHDGIDVGSVGRLRMLKKLAMVVPDHNKEEFLDSISKLTGLGSLKLWIPTATGFPSAFTQLISGNSSLTKLKLCGRLIISSEHLIFPPNLIKLTLENSQIIETVVELMVVLAKLPNLKFLYLHLRSYMGKEMVFSRGGFLKLQVLRLRDLRQLEELVVEEGALISLTHLDITNCERIEMLPDGLRQLTILQELQVHMPKRFIERLAENEGEDWEKIKHIPSVVIKGRS